MVKSGCSLFHATSACYPLCFPMDVCTPVPREQVKTSIKWELCCQPGQKRTDIISSISHIYPSSSLSKSEMETCRDPSKFVLEKVILKFILCCNIDRSEVCFCLWLCAFMFYLLAPCIFSSFTKTVTTMGYSKKINYSYLPSQSVFIVQTSSLQRKALQPLNTFYSRFHRSLLSHRKLNTGSWGNSDSRVCRKTICQLFMYF